MSSITVDARICLRFEAVSSFNSCFNIINLRNENSSAPPHIQQLINVQLPSSQHNHVHSQCTTAFQKQTHPPYQCPNRHFYKYEPLHIMKLTLPQTASSMHYCRILDNLQSSADTAQGSQASLPDSALRKTRQLRDWIRGVKVSPCVKQTSGWHELLCLVNTDFVFCWTKRSKFLVAVDSRMRTTRFSGKRSTYSRFPSDSVYASPPMNPILAQKSPCSSSGICPITWAIVSARPICGRPGR